MPARATRRITAAPRPAAAVGEGKRKGSAAGGKRRQTIELPGPGDGGVIRDPVALGTLAFDLLNDLNNNPNPLAKPTALFLMKIPGWLEFLGEVANARGENFSRDVKNTLRDDVLVDLGKTQTAEAIAKLIPDDAKGRSADELLSLNPYDPGTLKHKARLVLKYGRAVTIDAPRIQQILDDAKKLKIRSDLISGSPA